LFLPQPVTQARCIFHAANYLSSYTEVSRRFKGFSWYDIRSLSRRESMSNSTLSNSSSNLHISCLPLVQSYYLTLIHVQFADHLSVMPFDNAGIFSICINLF
jgi:hypothetical protein